jgi:FkbM family methyltransferase
MPRSHVCVEDHAMIRAAGLYYCAGDRWLETAHSLYPCLSTFVDVGMNRGFSAMHFLGMWAPELDATPYNWWKKHVDLGVWTNLSKGGQCGNCQDCTEKLEGPQRHRPLACTRARPVRVYSFDGSRPHVAGANAFVDAHWRALDTHWRRHHLAMSNASGTTHFEQGESEFQRVVSPVDDETRDGFRKRHGLTIQQVNQTTVDEFSRSHDLSAIDVLKIDVEGHDLYVLEGAKRTLRHAHVKLVYFEYGLSLPWLRAGGLHRAISLLDDTGFVCYFAGHTALVRITGCWTNRWDLWNKHSSLLTIAQVALVNVYCASRRDAAQLVEAFDKATLQHVLPPRYFVRGGWSRFRENLIEPTLKQIFGNGSHEADYYAGHWHWPSV